MRPERKWYSAALAARPVVGLVQGIGTDVRHAGVHHSWEVIVPSRGSVTVEPAHRIAPVDNRNESRHPSLASETRADDRCGRPLST